MSVIEIVVVVFGLGIGYWVVLKLFPGSPSGTQKSEAPETESRSSHGGAETPWYEVLGVPANASMDDIRRAYKSLISQYHPDKVSALGTELRELAEKKSKEITKAYREAEQLNGRAT